MPYIKRRDGKQDIKIYYEVYGNGEPIVFHHGNGNRSSDWNHLGYVDALKDQYQLILIDLRGYGNSSKPHDLSSYALKNRIEDTIAVLDELNISEAHCLGGSFTTAFLFLFARYFPERFKSYIFLTPGILFTQITDEDIKAAMLEGADAYLAKLEEWFGPLKNQHIRETMLANDGQALWASNSAEWFNYKDYIQYINKPSLIYTGSKEPINEELRTLSQRLPNCQLHIEPEFDHVDAYWRGDIAAPVIAEFIKGLSK